MPRSTLPAPITMAFGEQLVEQVTRTASSPAGPAPVAPSYAHLDRARPGTHLNRRKVGRNRSARRKCGPVGIEAERLGGPTQQRLVMGFNFPDDGVRDPIDPQIRKGD
jgi:hypothetical protein